MPWDCDPNHLRAQFSAKHLGIVTVTGFFRSVQATLDLDDDDPTRWSVVATIDVASLDTNNDIRDRKLKSAEYLDADRYPTISFRSTRVEPVGDGHLLYGDLTIHGVTREVALQATLNGEVTDAFGRVNRGFSARATLRRSDFDIHTSTLEPDTDGTSNEIRISIAAMARKQGTGDPNPRRRRSPETARGDPVEPPV
jgi:polyisoprenoid-binding protein YceI